MNIFVCQKCGFASFRDAPDMCPVCGAPRESFKEDSHAFKKPSDANNLSELEKKHIPLISLNKQCGLVGAECTDVYIKIGDILHPMEAKHYILHVDIYRDYSFICRCHFTPETINPALGIHLKVPTGTLQTAALCNIHGRWLAEIEF